MEKGFDQENLEHQDNQVTSDNDLETAWEDYWQAQGPSLVWQSWLEKYKEYINPEYLKTSKGEATSEDTTSEVHTTQGSETESDNHWATVWQEHQIEQRDYYFNWFSQWWLQSEESVETVLSLEELSLDSKSEMDEGAHSSDASVVKEQRDKTTLEKTEEYLTELGFSTTINQPSSIITECCKHSKNTKKSKCQKKKRVNLGKVPAQAGALFKVCAACLTFFVVFSYFSHFPLFGYARSEISCRKSILVLLPMLQIQLYRMRLPRMQMRPRK